MIYDKEEVNRFILSVFDYYNGRINPFNIARLKIEWSHQYGSTNGATSRNPNIITVYPLVLNRYFKDEYWFKFNIINCIIHELTHTDQQINFLRMKSDISYRTLIENITEMETFLYMSNHRIEIQRVFGLNYNNMDPYYPALYSSGLETGYMYIRRNYFTHMISMLQEITHSENNPIIELFCKVFNDANSVIIMNINNKEFTLKDQLHCMPLLQLNGIMEEEFYKYDLRSANSSMNQLSQNVYYLSIDTKCKNIMMKIINHKNKRIE